MWQTSLLCLCDIIFCLCKGNCAECSGAHAPVYFAQLLSSKMFELAGSAAHQNKVEMIIPCLP